MAEQQPSAPPRALSLVRRSAGGLTHVSEHQPTRYTIIGNHLTQHRDLSLTAIGLGAHIQSLPDGAQVDIRTLAGRFPEGRDRIAAALRELELCGYLERVRERTPEGRIVTRTFSYNDPGATRARRRAGEPRLREAAGPPAPPPVADPGQAPPSRADSGRTPRTSPGQASSSRTGPAPRTARPARPAPATRSGGASRAAPATRSGGASRAAAPADHPSRRRAHRDAPRPRRDIAPRGAAPRRRPLTPARAGCAPSRPRRHHLAGARRRPRGRTPCTECGPPARPASPGRPARPPPHGTAAAASPNRPARPAPGGRPPPEL